MRVRASILAWLLISAAATLINAQSATQPARRQVSAEQIFRQRDKNGDGKLTSDELGRPALFRRLDQDGDGVVTLEEAGKAFGATSRPAGGAGN